MSSEKEFEDKCQEVLRGLRDILNTDGVDISIYADNFGDSVTMGITSSDDQYIKEFDMLSKVDIYSIDKHLGRID